jgi:hypothetical protein
MYKRNNKKHDLVVRVLHEYYSITYECMCSVNGKMYIYIVFANIYLTIRY